MLNVLELNDVDELDVHRLLWQRLLDETREATFFQSLEWLETYWRHWGSQQKLRVLVVGDADERVGIMPLVVRTERTRLGPVRTLTYPLHDWGSFYGPISTQPTATLLAGLQHIGRTTRDWDVLDLRWVDRDGTDARRTQSALASLGLVAEERPWARSAIVDFDHDWEAYWRGRDTRFRKNTDRSEKKLSERGPIEYLRYRPGGARLGEVDPRWDLFNTCQELAASSWQGASRSGTTMSHASIRDFLRDAHAAAVCAGAADVNLLYVDGQPAAFAYCYVRGGQVFGLRMGYDATIAQQGSGAVLIRRMLEDSCRRGDVRFDLGPGYLDVKRHWQTSVATSYRYTHYPLGLGRAQLLGWSRKLRSGWRRVVGIAE